jgi:hypothetical protein
MKVSLATALSVAGVLAAGAAAYAVNVSVLDAPSASDSSIVSTTLPLGQAPAVPAGNLVGGAVTANGVRISETTTSYKVGDAGTVVVDTATGSVVVTSVVPNSGYTSEPARTDANGLVKVHFNSSTTRIEFTAQMVNGTVVVNVSNERMPAAPVAGNPTKPTIPGFGKDDDDDHEERHHENEHESDGDDD